MAFIGKTSGQDFKFAATLNSVSSQYGISGNKVFKIDAIGNSVWVKDFSGYIVPSFYPNKLISAVFDGKFLYVLELQGIDFSSLPHTYNPAIIKLDTMGNIVFIIKSDVFPGGSYNVIGIFPSFTNGVWVLDDYAPGFTHHGTAFQIDSLGQQGISIGLWYGSVATPRRLCFLPDSNYIVCTNHQPSSPGFGKSFPALIKFNDAGVIKWKADYSVSAGLYSNHLTEMATATDSIGNTFMICEQWIDGARSIAGIKISPNGNVLISKTWPDINWNYIQSFRYYNSELICATNGSEFHFDTLFNISCFTDQNIVVTKNNNYIDDNRIQDFTFTNFTPTDGSPLSIIPSLYVNYCKTLTVEENITDEKLLNIFPNPATSEINIRAGINEPFILTIIDPEGQIYINKKINKNSSVDISFLNKGIYFVSCMDGVCIKLKKLIIQ